ncbi:MAG: hypothetical protein HOV79_13615 [Hamadaea sp.]|nr:hypothetical protein [Hamadaea sp.]
MLGKVSGQTYETVFSTVYAGVKVNLCLAAAGLPLLLALAGTGNPLASWPFFAALSALCAPAVSGAFGAFRALSDGDPRIGTAYWRAYRATFGRSLAVGASAAAVVIVLAIDLQLAVGSWAGAVTPMLALLIGIVVATTTAVLAALPDESGDRWWRRVPACAYLAVRKWHLSLFNLALLATVAVVATAKPVVGLLLLPAPALYVVWANTRHLTAALRPASPTA